MNITQTIMLYVLTLPILPVLDLLWLGVIMKNFYREHLGHLMRADIAWSGAVGFYVLYTLGVLYFAILPAVASGDWHRALLLGAILGGFAYMTYDLTNYATLTGWPFIVVVVDVLWGAVLTGVIAVAGFFIARAIS